MKVSLSLLFHSNKDSQKLLCGKSSLVSPIVFVASASYPPAQGLAFFFFFFLAAPNKEIECEISPVFVAMLGKRTG